MKKSLDFNIRYNLLEGLTFIQRFTAVYMYLEHIDGTGEVTCKGGTNPCCGCGGVRCEYPTAVNKQTSYFFLFNTMTGNSSLRCRFDGEPTEMQRLIGDTDAEDHGCGGDFTVDFLFGYAGYEYRKCTDPAVFQHEIIASIDAGKPVIVKVKSGSPRFYVITGYDGDALIGCPYHCLNPYTDPGKMEEPPEYSNLDVLYVIGNKVAPRYTLKDGLNNIRRVMECNINERVWDGYLTKLGGWDKFPSDDGLDKASPEERKARATRVTGRVGLASPNMYVYNNVSFSNAFGGCCHEKLRRRDLYKELCIPVFAELWNNIGDPHEPLLTAGHHMGGFVHWNKDWLTAAPSEVAASSAGICETITKAKEADIQLLEIINRAIAILDKK